jgi:hypothetical protein
MKNSGIVLFTIVLAIVSTSLFAQREAKPFQIALYKPLQIVSEENSVQGFRLNVIYGLNQDVKGADIGIVNETAGEQVGAQLGIVNMDEGGLTGARAGIVNITSGHVKGYSSGIVNLVEGEATGWVTGGVNVLSDDISGLGSGVVTVAEGGGFKGAMMSIVNVLKPKDPDNNSERKGFQLGLVNYASSMEGVQLGLININKNAKLKFFPILLISKQS